MKQYHIAVLGATGAVGREMLKILLERQPARARQRPQRGNPHSVWKR